MSFVAETFIFLYVGMDALDIEKWRVVSDRYVYTLRCTIFLISAIELVLYSFFSPQTSIEVSAILLGLVMLGRAAFVFPLSVLSNFKKSPYEKIGFKQQVCILYDLHFKYATPTLLAST